jgi:hypothetical protein
VTAIAILATEDRAWIGSDGAAYTPREGTLRQIVPKVILCPEWDCVIGSLGMGGSAEAFRAAGQWKGVTDFDGLLSRAAELAREADDNLLLVHRGLSIHFTVVLVGYSRSRERFECHTVRTRPGMAWSAEHRRSVEVPPFTVSYQPGITLLPRPPEATAAAVGLRVPTVDGPFDIDSPDNFVMRAVLACRFDKGHGIGDEEGAHFYGVGGFVQLTRLVRHQSITSDAPQIPDQIVMDTQITHRWPDVIGELIDPMSGHLPAWIGEPLPEATTLLPEITHAEAAE